MEGFETDAVQLYLTQMGNVPLLSRQAEQDVARQIEISRHRYRTDLLNSDFLLHACIEILQKVLANQIKVASQSAIADVAGLRGKRVAVGPAGSGSALTAQIVLKGLGLEAPDVRVESLGYNEAAARLAAGAIARAPSRGDARGLPLPTGQVAVRACVSRSRPFGPYQVVGVGAGRFHEIYGTIGDFDGNGWIRLREQQADGNSKDGDDSGSMLMRHASEGEFCFHFHSWMKIVAGFNTAAVDHRHQPQISHPP